MNIFYDFIKYNHNFEVNSGGSNKIFENKVIESKNGKVMHVLSQEYYFLQTM